MGQINENECGCKEKVMGKINKVVTQKQQNKRTFVNVQFMVLAAVNAQLNSWL